MSDFKVPNDFLVTGYSRIAIQNSLCKDNIIPYSVLCQLILIYYPIINVKSFDKICVDSFRGHKRNLSGFDSLHPDNILINNSTIYASEISSRFNQGENDWIIFKNNTDKNDNIIYYPFKLVVRNRRYFQNRVKSFSFYIGNVEKNKWINLKPNVMTMNVNNHINQYFDLEYEYQDWSLIKKYRLNEYKLELIGNAASPPATHSKFALEYFEIQGVIQSEQQIHER